MLDPIPSPSVSTIQVVQNLKPCDRRLRGCQGPGRQTARWSVRGHLGGKAERRWEKQCDGRGSGMITVMK